jgi:hypothetical protein
LLATLAALASFSVADMNLKPSTPMKSRWAYLKLTEDGAVAAIAQRITATDVCETSL